MIEAYYNLEILSDNLKASNKIKVGAKTPRYDCTKFNGNYKGIKPFINAKGMFKLSLMECRDFVKTDNRRMAEFALVGGKSYNFSSLYGEDSNNIFYGYPNGKPFLRDGNQNPLFQYRNDLYIFLIDDAFKKIEILVLPNQKGFATELLQSFIEGDYDEEIDLFRNNYKTFFNYGCL